MRGAAARTAEQARQLQEDATEKAEQSLRRATSYLESNPLAFAGIAFVAGVLLSSCCGANERTSRMYELPELPYGYDALEPLAVAGARSSCTTTRITPRT